MVTELNSRKKKIKMQWNEQAHILIGAICS